MTHTVLVVEDEEDLRELIREALELNGFSVVTAPDGREALDALPRIKNVCLVLLDLLMPGMNGWDFFDELRRRPEYGSVPVVVHTSVTNRAPPGATRVLQKPLPLAQLLSVVREFCAQ